MWKKFVYLFKVITFQDDAKDVLEDERVLAALDLFARNKMIYRIVYSFEMFKSRKDFEKFVKGLCTSQISYENIGGRAGIIRKDENGNPTFVSGCSLRYRGTELNGFAVLSPEEARVLEDKGYRLQATHSFYHLREILHPRTVRWAIDEADECGNCGSESIDSDGDCEECCSSIFSHIPEDMVRKIVKKNIEIIDEHGPREGWD